jgi:hypothetical protein
MNADPKSNENNVILVFTQFILITLLLSFLCLIICLLDAFFPSLLPFIGPLDPDPGGYRMRIWIRNSGQQWLNSGTGDFKDDTIPPPDWLIAIFISVYPELGNRYRYNALATFSGQWAEWK